MSKEVNAVTLPERVNQTKTTCGLMSEKEDQIADDVTEKDVVFHSYLNIFALSSILCSDLVHFLVPALNIFP